MSLRPESAWTAMIPPSSSRVPDMSAPHHNAHALPLDQRTLPSPHPHNDIASAPQFSDLPVPHVAHDAPWTRYLQFDPSLQTHWTCPPPASIMTSPFTPPPRPPIPSPRNHAAAHMDGSMFSMENEAFPSFDHSQMRASSGQIPAPAGAYAMHVPPNVANQRRHPSATRGVQPPISRQDGQASPLSSDGGMSDRARLLQLHNRRYWHQDPYHRNLNYSGHQTSAGFLGQGRRSDRSISPRTSATRRNYDRFSQDEVPTMSSSDMEEATARLPPFSRARHRLHEPRPRLFVQPQHVDPNVVSPRQVQELKAKLPRRVAGELPEDAGHECNICQKEYGSTHTQACEEQEIAVELPCGHFFGEFCVFHWFDTCLKHKNKVTCPMCRNVLIEPLRLQPGLALARGGAAWQEVLRAEVALGAR